MATLEFDEEGARQVERPSPTPDVVAPRGQGLAPRAPQTGGRVRADARSGPWFTTAHGDAVVLPFPDGSFDAAVSTQVYEYVADMPRALAELRRVLRPGGRAVVLDTDWDSL